MSDGYLYPDFTGGLSADGRSSEVKSAADSTSGHYVISAEDAKVVDIAIKLQRPLLVEGEAGCGKTQLAYAIASQLGLEGPIRIQVKSTSQAKDLFYRFDALGRLQDSQNVIHREKAQWVYKYISLEPFGEAIRSGQKCVVLIDEIDKADIDFPNDLLDVLDENHFQVDDLPASEETAARADIGYGRQVSSPSAVKPIVVITSNQEKSLPEAFLRRCIFLELSFPADSAVLNQIVGINLKKRGVDNISESLIASAVKSFLNIREGADRHNAQKKPATAELIDWVHALHWRGNADGAVQGITPPYWRLLFKCAQDIRQHQRLAETETLKE